MEGICGEADRELDRGRSKWQTAHVRTTERRKERKVGDCQQGNLRNHDYMAKPEKRTPVGSLTPPPLKIKPQADTLAKEGTLEVKTSVFVTITGNVR